MDVAKEDKQRVGVTEEGQCEIKAGGPLWQPLKGAAEREDVGQLIYLILVSTSTGGCSI